ncbi:unnamed protein product [Cochlearia groenlandica]
MALTFSSTIPFVFILLLSISSVTIHAASQHHTAAPAPSVDCSTLILNMADCLSFVSSGSTDAKPQGTCCSGLKTVLKSDAECLCEAFKSSASFGVTLNITKASSLPTACKLHAPSISKCGLSVAPTMAPGLAPGGAAFGPGGAAFGPGGAAFGPGGAGILAPNSSPGNDGSYLVPISVTTLFSGLLFGLFLSFV